MKKLIIVLLGIGLYAGIAHAIEDLQYLRPLRTQNVSITTTSQRIATQITGNVNIVRIVTNQDAFISVGISYAAGLAATSNPPIATAATGFPIQPNVPTFIRVNPGEYIAIKASTTSGSAFFTEMSK